jgi:hypothetical protein
MNFRTLLSLISYTRQNGHHQNIFLPRAGTGGRDGTENVLQNPYFKSFKNTFIDFPRVVGLYIDTETAPFLKVILIVIIHI